MHNGARFYLFGLYVVSEMQIYRSAQNIIAGPFHQFNFGDQFRRYPCRVELPVGFFLNGHCFTARGFITLSNASSFFSFQPGSYTSNIL